VSNVVAVYKILALIIKTLQYFIGVIEEAEYHKAISDIRKGSEQAKTPSNSLPDRAEGAKRVQDALNRGVKNGKS
jgi:hypothetical protein